MRYPDRVTMCVSSQAGCGMGCPFCATGQAGLTRNLSTAEIVEQVVAGARVLAAARSGRPGPGVQRGVHGHGRAAGQLPQRGRPRCGRLTDPVPDGLGISAALASPCPRSAWSRRSAGWPPRGCRSRSPCRCTPRTTRLRDELVPVNRRWKVAEVLDAAWDYAAATGRRVSIEYALIRDINDQAWRADLLGDAAGRAPGARQPDPAQPDAGLEVDRLPAGRPGRVRAAARGPRRAGHGPGHPGPGDRRRLRPAGGSVRPSACLRPRPWPGDADPARPYWRHALAGWCTGPGRRCSRPG